MSNFPILSLLTFLPLVGAAFILIIRGEGEVVARNARHVALWTSLINFLLSLFIWVNFDPTTADYQFVESAQWMPAFNIHYKMGIDGISMLFVLLTTLLPLAFCACSDISNQSVSIRGIDSKRCRCPNLSPVP